MCRLSAMAAAGLGNTISDVCGVFLSSRIEAAAGLLGCGRGRYFVGDPMA